MKIIKESVTLTEKNWKYQLDAEGKLLRDTLDLEEVDVELIKKVIKVNLFALKKLLPEDEFEINDLIDEVDTISDTDDDYEESIDYVLDKFYDFCDINSVWVGV